MLVVWSVALLAQSLRSELHLVYEGVAISGLSSVAKRPRSSCSWCPGVAAQSAHGRARGCRSRSLTTRGAEGGRERTKTRCNPGRDHARVIRGFARTGGTPASLESPQPRVRASPYEGVQ